MSAQHQTGLAAEPAVRATLSGPAALSLLDTFSGGCGLLSAEDVRLVVGDHWVRGSRDCARSRRESAGLRHGLAS